MLERFFDDINQLTIDVHRLTNHFAGDVIEPPPDDKPPEDNGLFKVKSVTKGVRAKIRPKPSKTDNEIGFIFPGDTVLVYDAKGDYWNLEVVKSYTKKYIGTRGYVFKKDAFLD